MPVVEDGYFNCCGICRGMALTSVILIFEALLSSFVTFRRAA
jgi:hypothetical protein